MTSVEKAPFSIRCLVGLHFWTKWITTADKPLKEWPPASAWVDGAPKFEILVGRSIDQERTCSLCGIAQLRREQVS